MGSVVIDTNVILTAKGMSEQATAECIAACQERLDQIIEGPERVVIDDNWIILGEYLDYLDNNYESTTNARNAGHFLDWFIRNHENPDQCVQVHITPSEDGIGFAELPIAFSNFDSDDNKFITVAVVFENEYHHKAIINLRCQDPVALARGCRHRCYCVSRKLDNLNKYSISIVQWTPCLTMCIS